MASTKKKAKVKAEEEVKTEAEAEAEAVPETAAAETTPDFIIAGGALDLGKTNEPPIIIDDAHMQSHNDLIHKARQNRAIQEAEQRLNRIHEIEIQIKTQQIRDPKVILKDDNGKTWEDYHDLFWQVKRGLQFKDDPFRLNTHLAHLLKEDRLVAWQQEGGGDI
jgi:hypothetical protein